MDQDPIRDADAGFGAGGTEATPEAAGALHALTDDQDATVPECRCAELDGEMLEFGFFLAIVAAVIYGIAQFTKKN